MSKSLAIASIELTNPTPDDQVAARGGAGGTLWEYANAPAHICVSARDFWSALSEAPNLANRPGGDVLHAEGIHWDSLEALKRDR